MKVEVTGRLPFCCIAVFLCPGDFYSRGLGSLINFLGVPGSWLWIRAVEAFL